jgi:predicted nuclease of predicted toxin-antitoxin system
LTLVTQDADFSEMSEVQGFPPKVILIRRGNCSTGQIESMLRQHREAIARLDEDATAGILTVL